MSPSGSQAQGAKAGIRMAAEEALFIIPACLTLPTSPYRQEIERQREREREREKVG